MGKPVKTYDLKAVYLLVGGYRIGGFGEQGAVSFEYGSNLVETTISADGQGTVSRSNDDSMTATITVMETSKSYKDLAALMVAQQAQSPITRLEFLMKDDINGDKVSARHAVFTMRPKPNKAKKVGEREFELWLPNAGENAQFGANIAI